MSWKTSFIFVAFSLLLLAAIWYFVNQHKALPLILFYAIVGYVVMSIALWFMSRRKSRVLA